MTASGSGELGEIGAQRGLLTLTRHHGHVQLLEVLLQHLAAELRLLLGEEAVDVGLRAGRAKPGTALAQRRQPWFGERRAHRVPGGFAESPRQLAAAPPYERAPPADRAAR